MITIQRKSNVYGVKHFVVDEKSDLSLFRKDLLYMGSTAYVIASGEKYIVNGRQEWVLIPKTGSSSSDDPGNNNPEDGDTIIYDGGEVLG